MSDKFLFNAIKEEFGRELRTDINCPFVNNNLNPKLALRDYQKQAFTRFYKYYETTDAQAYTKPSENIHLAYHMATGSGKTVVMAGLILYLYAMGYRNFLFFVNRGQIVEKTKDNFINTLSSKYLFNEKIVFNNKQVNIMAVDNFAYSSHDDINICFTTIQGLFSDFNNEKENSLTLEDFKENKIALIADEAHHINASTKKPLQIDWDKPSWENTVEKIFRAHQSNILLEFSATIELDNQEVKEKYLDKILYQYDLRDFVQDGFSKKINLLKSDTNKETRILQALITSIYREHVAIKQGLNIKPIILFKSSRIIASQGNQKEFHQQLEALTIEDLKQIKKTSNIEVLRQAFDFFNSQNISLYALVDKIKTAFLSKYCLCTNNDKELELNQKRLNNLEDKDNAIRAIFTVDKLNEGWDVLNLFDIVRLCSGQTTSDSNTGKIGAKTVSEAQLIGRGARYCPFKIKLDDEAYKRKFDADITHELRVLEELYFHSEDESRYITEINKALVQSGLIEEEENAPSEFKLELKDSIKNNATFQGKSIFKNEKTIKKYNHVKNLNHFGIVKTNFKYEIQSGKGSLIDALNENENKQSISVNTKTYKLCDFIGVNIIKNALLSNDAFTFKNLQIPFPNLASITDFLGDDYLGEIKIDLAGNSENLTTKDKLDIALLFLNALAQEIKSNVVEFEGTKEFKHHTAIEIFNEKTLLLAKDNEKSVKPVDADWFVFKEFYGTSEEEKLIALIAKLISPIQAKYKDVYLIRNERHFALYDFEQGRRFEPDFVLVATNTNNNANYQIFIEPKGKHIQQIDQWKETFLLAIKDNARTVFEHTNQDYRIIGLEFYNHNEENIFQESLQAELPFNATEG